MVELNRSSCDSRSSSGTLSCVDIEVDFEVPTVDRSPELAQSQSTASRGSSDSESAPPFDVNPGSPSPLHEAFPLEDRHIFNFRRVAQILLASVVIIILGLSIWFIFRPRRHKTDDGCKLSFTVSKNGTSDFRTITEAVAAAPSYSVFTTCILIKKGEYHETVKIGNEKTNILLKGEGIDNTVITSASSSGDAVGWQVATLWVIGEGFLSRDLTITNPAKAGVAVKNSASDSMFFKCRFVGSNETLYAEKQVQLYHSCGFHGTNYLVIGDAVAYFHNCNFYSANTSPNEEVVFAGQSRNAYTFKAGFTFHYCGFYSVDRSINKPKSVFVGHLLGHHAVIIVMQSFLDAYIDGYLIDVSPPYTTYFAIFENIGGGATMKHLPPFVQVLCGINIQIFLEGFSRQRQLDIRSSTT